jgi:hypothetical protein
VFAPRVSGRLGEGQGDAEMWKLPGEGRDGKRWWDQVRLGVERSGSRDLVAIESMRNQIRLRVGFLVLGSVQIQGFPAADRVSLQLSSFYFGESGSKRTLVTLPWKDEEVS